MQRHQFDLNLLKALDVLLRERNVTHAAERLHITQQAMSGALRRLREQFDDPLLVRSGRVMQLTPQALALVDPVREAMGRIDLALDAKPSFDPTESDRRFKVAMSDYAAVTILPSAAARISAEAPRLVLDVRAISDSTYEELERGDLDLCLLPADWTLFGDRPPRNVRSEPLYDEDFVCIAGRANPAVGDEIDPDQYLALPQVTLRLGSGVCSVVEAAWRAQRLSPRIAASAATFSAMIFMVVDSVLIATVQRRLAHQFAWMLPLRVLECPIAIEPLHANMNWHSSRDDDPAHRYLRNVFAAAGAHPSSDKRPL